MYLPNRGNHQLTTLLLVTIIVVGSLLMAFLNVVIADDEQRKTLQDRAKTIAYALNSSDIATLSGTAADQTTSAYRELKSRLTALKQASADIRGVYLAGIRQGTVFFFVDSEPPSSPYFSLPGESYPEATTAFKNLFSGSPALVEGPLTDRFGSWVSGLAPVVDLQTGRAVAVVGIDVTSQTYYQALIVAAAPPLLVGAGLLVIILVYEYIRRRDKQLLQLRSELVSIASHELRTPITGIRWAVELLLKKTPGTAYDVGAKNIHNNILHLQAGVEDILQLTHTIQAKQKLNLEPCDLKVLVTDVCDTQKLAAEQKQVALIMDAWPVKVPARCDADKLKRALHNVVSNAIKYTRENTQVTIRYRVMPKEHHIIVEDHGIGIPKEEQGKVFGGFYRASNAKATGTQGTGLGLYLTRAIFAHHHGRVEFTSQEGKGTVFTLVLPRYKK